MLGGLAKAAISRHLVPILTDLFRTSHQPASLEDRQILHTLEALDAIYQSFDTEEYALTVEQVATLQTSVRDFLHHYRWLSVSSGAFRWQEIPKHHVLQHIALQGAHQNPRWGWTYVDEDWMGLIQDISQSCLSGTVPTKWCQRWWQW